MFATDNTIKVLIGKNVTASGTSIDSLASTFLVDGQIAILTQASTLTGAPELVNPGTAADREYVRFVQRSGSTLHYSPRIKVANILSAKAAKSIAPVDQVDHIGFNGTSGSIEELSNNQYLLHITYKHDTLIWSEQLNKRTYGYYSDSSATQKEIANSFVKQINSDAYTAVSAVMLTNGTFQASSSGTYAVNKGSNIIVGANSGDNKAGWYNTDGTKFAAGDLIRLGGTTAGFPVYQIESISGGDATAATITLTTPYQGTSNATLAAANVGYILSPTSFGIQLTGLTLTHKPKGLAPYNRVKFETALANFGSTAVANTTTMVFGSGVAEQVADMEWFALGGDGIRNFMWHPVPEGREDYVAGQYYHTVAIEYYNNDDQYVISGSKPSKALIYLFFATGTAADTFPSETNWTGFVSNWNLYVPAKFELAAS